MFLFGKQIKRSGFIVNYKFELGCFNIYKILSNLDITKYYIEDYDKKLCYEKYYKIFIEKKKYKEYVILEDFLKKKFFNEEIYFLLYGDEIICLDKDKFDMELIINEYVEK
jgi:hypothetical protein